MTPRAFFISAAWAALTLTAPAFAESGQFCVQSFNVYGPAYASGVEYRLSRLAEEIVKAPCAATQFQEFWRDGQYQNFKEEISAARLAMVRADEYRSDGSMTGLASAFAGHVISARSALFSVNNEGGVLDWFRDLSGVQKGYSALEVKLDNGPAALFLNLHDHPTEESIRVAQVAELAEAMLADPSALKSPLILTGDLNATPEGPELAILRDILLLRDSYVEANGAYGNECTYCGDNPLSWSSEDRVIDFVLVRNSPDIELISARSEFNLKGEKYDPLSDHFGVKTDFRWQNREPRLLSLSDSTVKERMAKALVTAETTASILASREVDSPAALRFWEMGETLRRGELPPQLSHFLIP
jgi:endonuclease/exonuclease/phosphatase family metal-dependent hydrolase